MKKKFLKLKYKYWVGLEPRKRSSANASPYDIIS